jgi:concanavalin A-like lectin/glucanase superfamily protein/ephrin receptor-like protein
MGHRRASAVRQGLTGWGFRFHLWLLAVLVPLVAASVPGIGGVAASAATLPGIAHYYPAEGTAGDAVGGINGSIVGAVSFPAGVVGSAFSFDGGYVDLGSTLGNFGTADFTIAFWMNAPPEGGQLLVKRPSNLEMIDITLWGVNDTCCLPGHVVVELRGESATPPGNNIYVAWISAAGGLNDGQWHHVAVVRNGNTASLYVDGVLDTVSADLQDLSLANSDPMTLGASLLYDLRFHGLLDDVQFYDSGLSGADVLSLIQCRPGSYSVTGNLPCTLAPVGSYVASPGAVSATLCPAGTTTAAPGAISASDCKPLRPTRKDQCKNGGWRAYGFRNQGDCVSYVEHHNS